MYFELIINNIPIIAVVAQVGVAIAMIFTFYETKKSADNTKKELAWRQRPWIISDEGNGISSVKVEKDKISFRYKNTGSVAAFNIRSYAYLSIVKPEECDKDDCIDHDCEEKLWVPIVDYTHDLGPGEWHSVVVNPKELHQVDKNSTKEKKNLIKENCSSKRILHLGVKIQYRDVNGENKFYKIYSHFENNASQEEINHRVTRIKIDKPYKK